VVFLPYSMDARVIKDGRVWLLRMPHWGKSQFDREFLIFIEVILWIMAVNTTEGIYSW
jgi:hypothetical protein